jgi:hypothetical protein
MAMAMAPTPTPIPPAALPGCGHVGCCDSVQGQACDQHFPRIKHPLIRSIEPGEAWIWCYVDKLSPGEIAA